MTSDLDPRPPAVTALADGLVSTTFPAALADGGTTAAPSTATHIRAVEHGFYQHWYGQAEVDQLAQTFVQDAQQLTGVYPDPQFAARQSWGAAAEKLGFGPELPVGTFADFDKTLNAGGPQPVAARLITAVTVNPGFRRRGILKHMITSRLADAVRAQVPVAVLTVSEGGIYGRFGFGQATRGQSIELNTSGASDSFALRNPPTGQVLTVDPTRLEQVLRETFAGFHRATRGSVDRPEPDWKEDTARWNPDDITRWNRRLRAVVHVKDDGDVGGCAVFSHLGWESDPSTVRVRDLFAVDAASRIELLRHLASMDLVERIRLGGAPVDDPLTHAMTNPRARRVTGENDILWLRVLDVRAALQARGWGSDGEFLLRLSDSLGISAGTYRVAVVGGAATVTPGGPSSTAVTLTTDAETLGSLYLGDVSVRTLYESGRIRAEAADVQRLCEIVDLPTAPYCATVF